MANVFERCLRQQSRAPNTHSHANAHTPCHTHSHTQPRHGTTHHHHTPTTQTKAHQPPSLWGTPPQTPTGPGGTQNPPHTQPVRSPRGTYMSVLGARGTHTHLTEASSANRDTHEADTHTHTHSHSHTKIFTHSPLLDPHTFFVSFTTTTKCTSNPCPLTRTTNSLQRAHTYSNARPLTQAPTVADTQRHRVPPDTPTPSHCHPTGPTCGYERGNRTLGERFTGEHLFPSV